jgi:hypothetical protein
MLPPDSAELHFLGKQERQKFWLVIVRPYNAYVDESGADSGSPVISVAGWLGTYQTWIAFDRDWRDMLKRFGEDFHYSDFWARRSYGADWLNAERLDFVKELAAITRQYAIYGICFAVRKDDYDACIPPQIRSALKNDPYYFCVGHFASMVVRWYDQMPVAQPAKPLHFLFDRKPGSEGFATSVFYQVRSAFDRNEVIGDIAFGSRREYPGLQAADLLGGELRRYLQGKQSEVLPIFQRLVFSAPRREDLIAKANELLSQIGIARV